MNCIGLGANGKTGDSIARTANVAGVIKMIVDTSLVVGADRVPVVVNVEGVTEAS